MGWRYLLFTLGGLMLLLAFIRLFLFNLYESPRFLVGRGRDAEAVAVIHAIAKYNGIQSTLVVEDLEEAGRSAENGEHAEKWRVLSQSSTWSAKHVRALFASKKLAWSTSLLISIWGTSQRVFKLIRANGRAGIIGLASTLYNNFLPFLYVMPLSLCTCHVLTIPVHQPCKPWC